MAKWTAVTTGPDGRFSIRSEWDDRFDGIKGYAMSVFKLESGSPIRLDADLVDPLGVDLDDFAAFSLWWLDSNCDQSNDCQGADFEPDGDVDLSDLQHLCEYWLWGKE